MLINNPKVSIITVVHNNKEGLEKTINSVASQTYQNIECIVIDGRSNDGTIDVIKKYQDKIDYWVSEQDKGIYDAMNKGAKKATGDYLYFLNSGDYFYNSEVLSKISKHFIENYDLILGNVIRLYPNYKNLCKPNIKKLRWGKMPPHPGSFIKRKIFNELNGYNIKYRSSGDLDLFYRLHKKSCSYRVVRNKVAYMPSGGFSSNKDISLPESYNIIKKHLSILHAISFYLRKAIIEQGAKKILLFFGLEKFYEKLLKIKMKGFK